MGTAIFNAKIRTKINTKPMTAPIRSFFAFSVVLLVGFGDFHPKEDAVDGPHGDDDRAGGPEVGVEYLPYRLDERIEINVSQNKRVQIFPSFIFVPISSI